MPLGVPELLIILVIVLLILGPKRLPGIGRQLGGGIREFKQGISKKFDHDDEDAGAALGQGPGQNEQRIRRTHLGVHRNRLRSPRRFVGSSGFAGERRNTGIDGRPALSSAFCQD